MTEKRVAKNWLILEAAFIERVKRRVRDIQVKLEGVEREEFAEALLAGPEDARACAESFGFMLSQDMIKEITPMLESHVDQDAFAEAFTAAAGRNKIVDYDEDWAASIASIANLHGFFAKEA